MKKFFLNFYLFIFSNIIYGQNNSFEFLKIPVDAKLNALGGYNITLSSENNNFFYNNPATIKNGKNKTISASFLNYLANIKGTNIYYIDSVEFIGKFGIGIKHFNYGKTDSYDMLGNYLGIIEGNEFELILSKSKQMGQFIYGANIKYIYSKITNHINNAIFFDLGGILYPTYNKEFSIGISLRNFGFLFSEFKNQKNNILPFDVQLGTTIKPEYMPLRFSITIFNIYNGNKKNISNKENSFSNKLLSKINLGTEILISKNINLQLGYNYLKRKELSYETRKGGSGFSYGILLKIKRICINYARSLYNIPGESNSISLSLNVKNIIK